MTTLITRVTAGKVSDGNGIGSLTPFHALIVPYSLDVCASLVEHHDTNRISANYSLAFPNFT